MTEDLGLRFACQSGCTKCCEREGFVYVSNADIERLSAFLAMEESDFESRYVYRMKRSARLRVGRLTRCPFLKNDGCSVHPAKPTQCRTFPFWPELIDEPKEWRKTGSWCPGINQGDLVQIEHARTSAEEMRASYPTLYGG